MTERRVNQILDEWRELERRIATGPVADERAVLARRVAELRAEYQRLSSPDQVPDGGAGLPVEPSEQDGGRALV